MKTLVTALLIAGGLSTSVPLWAQQPQGNTKPQPSASPANQAAPAEESASPGSDSEEAPPPGDWAPELLDAILSSPNPDAREALYDAAFAAGPAIIPQLQSALKDDRTAEFAAQMLAFMAPNAIDTLAKLLSDPRDLDLRRFYFGTLGELHSADAARVLMYAVDHADEEPDRTVTEAAILALTVRSDSGLIPQLEAAATKSKDFVIRDDIENAVQVIKLRNERLASAKSGSGTGSLENAVRSYFIPALEQAPAPKRAPVEPLKGENKSTPPARGSELPPNWPSKPLVNVEVQSLTFSPDKNRALAHVLFEDPSAQAYYDIVLAKHFGDWTVASVWLGNEVEKPVQGTGDRGQATADRDQGRGTREQATGDRNEGTGNRGQGTGKREQ